MRNIRVARRYARALMDVATETKALDTVVRDLDSLQKTIDGSRDLQLLLVSPVIPALRKRSLLREIFAGKIGPTTAAFVDLLTAKQRERLLPDVVEQFLALRDEELGIVTVQVTAAAALSAAQTKALTGELERFTKKSVRVQFSLDTAIKGGLVVRIGDTVLDASISRQLELLRERFAQGGPLTN